MAICLRPDRLMSFDLVAENEIPRIPSTQGNLFTRALSTILRQNGWVLEHPSKWPTMWSVNRCRWVQEVNMLPTSFTSISSRGSAARNCTIPMSRSSTLLRNQVNAWMGDIPVLGHVTRVRRLSRH